VSGAARLLVLLGVVLVAIGLVLTLAPRWAGWIGRLPGDVRVERGGFRFYFPLTTSILVSVLLTLALKLLGRR
jgi:hypothetical protein